MGPLRTSNSPQRRSLGPIPTFWAMAEAASTVVVLNSRNAQSICCASSARLVEGLDIVTHFAYPLNILRVRYLHVRYMSVRIIAQARVGTKEEQDDSGYGCNRECWQTSGRAIARQECRSSDPCTQQEQSST